MLSGTDETAMKVNSGRKAEKEIIAKTVCGNGLTHISVESERKATEVIMRDHWNTASWIATQFFIIICLSCGGQSRAVHTYLTGLNEVHSYDICESESCKDAAASILQNMNSSVDPCHDFYEFVCGGWKANNRVPPTRDSWNRFMEVEQGQHDKLRTILETPLSKHDHPAVTKAKQFYSACLKASETSEGDDEQNMKPMLERLLAWGGWPMAQSRWNPTRFNWQQITAQFLRSYMLPVLFQVTVDADRKNTSRHVIIVDQFSSMDLPGAVLTGGDKYESQRDALRDWISATAFEIARVSGEDVDILQVAEQADHVVEFETSLYKISTRREERRDNFRMYNPRTIAALQSWTDGAVPIHVDSAIQWLIFFRELFQGLGVEINDDERIIVKETDFIFKLVELIDRTPRRVLANYMLWRLIGTFNTDVTTKMRRLSFKFERAIFGTSEEDPTWKRCTDQTEEVLGFALGYEYVRKFFQDGARRNAEEMVANIRETFVSHLEQIDWMDGSTRTAAMDKAKAMKQFIGYPYWYHNHTALDTYYKEVYVGESHFMNIENIMSFHVEKMLKSLRKPVDRNEWPTSPAIVNAFYSPSANAIAFPAGILQPPFFSKGRPEALNYGGIGVVIGHEIVHGFDDMGRQTDKEGNLVQWWSASTMNTYLLKSHCIIEQYQKYRVPELDHVLGPSASLNGVITQGENIADNGGLTQALQAYRWHIERHGPEPGLPGLEEYSSEQLFFIGFASNWCEINTKESLLNDILSDSHSPAKFRVLGPLANSEDFAKAWNCPAFNEISSMNPRNKCKVW